MPHDTTSLILGQGCIQQKVPFEERVAAAAAGGFGGIGLAVTEYDRLRDSGYTDRDLTRILDEHGVAVVELEAVFGFAVPDPDTAPAPFPDFRYTNEPTLDRIFGMADLFGSRHVQAIGALRTEVVEDDVVERFAALCDRAASHDLLVCIEFQRCTNIADAPAATRIVTEADRRNGGICLDTWHHFRGRNDDALLRQLPAEKVFVIQLNDGTMQPAEDDYIVDTLRHRMPPGRGEFDLGGFFDLLADLKIDAPISVEVMSEAEAARTPRQVAVELGDSTRAVLANARTGVDRR